MCDASVLDQSNRRSDLGQHLDQTQSRLRFPVLESPTALPSNPQDSTRELYLCAAVGGCDQETLTRGPKEAAPPLALLAPQTTCAGQPRGRTAVVNGGPNRTPPARHTQGGFIAAVADDAAQLPGQRGGLCSASARRPNSCHFMPTPRRSVGPGRRVQHSALPCFIAVRAGHRCRAHTQRGHLLDSASSLACPPRSCPCWVEARLPRAEGAGTGADQAGRARGATEPAHRVRGWGSFFLPVTCSTALFGSPLDARWRFGRSGRRLIASLGACVVEWVYLVGPRCVGAQPPCFPPPRACRCVHIGVRSHSEATWSLRNPTAGLRR